MDEFDPQTMMLLLKVQGDLQKSMVLSQELLKPYAEIDLDSIAPPIDVSDNASFGDMILPKESRNAIRNGAQALLTELRKTENSTQTTENLSENEDTNVGNSTANTQ
jgi:hypothetical protein